MPQVYVYLLILTISVSYKPYQLTNIVLSKNALQKPLKILQHSYTNAFIDLG